MMETDSKGKKTEYLATNDGLDRVSHLPDPILSHIFSFLPTEDSVRTIFLSKNWKSLWSPLLVVDLDFERFCESFKILRREDQKRRFTDFVDRMIVLHQGRHLQELRLALSISPFGRTSSLIRKWVHFALTSNSTTLVLEFSTESEGQSDDYLYKLPACSSVVRSVTVLKLTACKFIPWNFEKFESLQTLILTAVELPKNSLRTLFSKCPMLEELHLTECTVPSEFDFDAPNSKLKCLVMKGCCGKYDDIESIDIKIPSLIKLNFEGDMIEDFHVANLKNLIEVNICFQDGSISYDNHFMVQNLLRGLCNVNTLSLCSQSLQIDFSETLRICVFLDHTYIEFLSTLKLISSGGESYKRGETLGRPLNNLKHLKLRTCLEDFELKGLTCLLRSSPYLETLSLKLSLPFYKAAEFWNSQLVPFDCLHHLKKIELQNFQGLSNEMEFAKFMLENALVLKEMVIYKTTMESTRVYKEQHLKLLRTEQKVATEKLLGITRVSLDAQILLV